MERSFGCQVCLVTCKKISKLKKHMHSQEHKLKMQQVFQKDKWTGTGFFPCIIWIDPYAQRDVKHPIVGLSLLTLCFSQSTLTCFYLCHICQEKCSTSRILTHLFSGDHYSSYFNYTNPDVLSFCWVPGMDVRTSLRPELTREVNQRGSGSLQLLDLPQTLMNKFERSTYLEVMRTLSENNKLSTLFEAVEPKRTMIQTYQRDSNRKHPLLGMQHLVECVCVGQTEKRYYLCTLCKLTLATHMIIRHVLSFDHIFCFFKTWHPSTLLSKECYKEYTNHFASVMINLAEQAEEIHGSANSGMKQVSLNSAQFASVNFASYAEALKKLESITKESLITVVKPGNKLECVTPTYKIRCQNCSAVFVTKSEYSNHVMQKRHKQMLMRIFGKAETDEGLDQRGVKPVLSSYSFFNKSREKKQQVVGAALVVTCLSTETQVEPFCICFACEACFPESSVADHFDSLRHHTNTLVHLNPWRLPFGWDKHLDVKVLQAQALQEEQERGSNHMKLKVLDIPHEIFCLLTLDFQKVMKTLRPQDTFLMAEVPQPEMHIKLKDNEKFPLLGQQFLVLFSACYQGQEKTEMKSLCLLCKRILTDDESCAHLFSREHVENFLKKFHPGSLGSNTDAETLMDLAKQAARHECKPKVQVMNLEKPMLMPCSYQRATCYLGSVLVRRGNKQLRPPIRPLKKLFPRKSLKKEKSDMRHDNQKHCETMEVCEGNTTQMSPNNTEMSLRAANTSCVKSENAEKRVDAETPTVSEKETEMEEEVFSKTSSEEIKDAASDSCQATKEEKEEEPTAGTPSEEMMESCSNTENDEEKSKSCQNVPTQLQNYKQTERKRPNCSSEQNSNEDEKEKEKGCKRPRLSPGEEPKHLPGVKQEEKAAADVGESDQRSLKTTEASSNTNQQAAQLYHYVNSSGRDPVIGLSALIECSCDEFEPIYLCQCCSLKIRESVIINHVTGFYHQKKYLGGLQKLPPLGKNCEQELKHLAALFEKENGYGEAEAADLDEKIYNSISEQNFKSAMKTLKAFQVLQHRLNEPPLTSAQSGVQAANRSAAPHAEVFPGTDNFQVLKMETDKSENSEARPPSVTTAAATRATESNVKMDKIKVSENADGGNTCLMVPGSRRVSSGLRVSTSGKNTGNDSDASVTSATVASVVATPNMTSTKSSDTITSTVPVATPTCAAANNKLTGTSDKCVVVSSCAAAHLKASKATGAAPAQTPQTVMKSKTTETSVKRDDSETAVTTVHMESSVGFDANVAPDIAKSNSPAAPHLNTPKCVNSEKRHPPEPSHTAARNTTLSEDPAGVESADSFAQTGPELLPAAASVEAGCQNPSRPGNKADDAPKYAGYSAKPPGALQALPVISIGERSHGCSHLSKYLQVMGLEPVIGLDTVWECRGITLDAFFLCESCTERLSFSDICQHLVSHQHQLKYMRRRYPQYYQPFWLANDLHNYMKLDILKPVAMMISAQERYKKMDAQGILLGEDLYEYVRTAPFSEALEIVQNIKEAPLRAYCPPGLRTRQQIDQQPVDQDTAEESQSQLLDTDEKNDSDKGQKTEKEETVKAADLDRVKQSRASNPVDVKNVSSGADAVVCPLPGAGTSLSPLDTCRSLCLQTDLSRADSQQQMPLTDLQAKQQEAPSESPYFSVVTPKTSQTQPLSAEDDKAPASKSPAVTPLETPVGPRADNSYLENDVSVKFTCSSQWPISQSKTESASESDTPTLLSSNGAGSDEQDASTTHSPLFQHLLALLRELKSERNKAPRVSTPNNAETSAACPSSSSEGDAKRRWDQQCVQTKDKIPPKITKWDSRCEHFKVTVRQRRTSADPCEGTSSAAAPADYEDQVVKPNASSASFGHDSSLEGCLKKGNPLFNQTEAQTVGTMIPSASTADFTDPQHRGGVPAPSISGNVSHVKPSPLHRAAANLNPGQTPQPQAMTPHFGPRQQPINPIITARPDARNQPFVGVYNRPNHTEVNRGSEVAQRFLVVPSGSSDDALAASGQYGQYGEMYSQPYVTNGQPVYLPAEALAGYTTQYSPPVYAGTHAALTAAEGTSEAAYLYAAPFTAPANGFIPVQSSNFVITQSLGHPVICYPSANYQGPPMGSDFYVTTS